jgi:hypothetical protein
VLDGRRSGTRVAWIQLDSGEDRVRANRYRHKPLRNLLELEGSSAATIGLWFLNMQTLLKSVLLKVLFMTRGTNCDEHDRGIAAIHNR